MHTEIVNKALNSTWRMQEKPPMKEKLSREEAQEILDGLLKEENEEDE